MARTPCASWFGGNVHGGDGKPSPLRRKALRTSGARLVAPRFTGAALITDGAQVPRTYKTGPCYSLLQSVQNGKRNFRSGQKPGEVA